MCVCVSVCVCAQVIVSVFACDCYFFQLQSFEDQHSAIYQHQVLSSALQEYYKKKLTEFETGQIELHGVCVCVCVCV